MAEMDSEPMSLSFLSPLLHQSQSETLTGQISLPLQNTDHFEEPVNVCLSHPSLSVILDCRRQKPEKGAAKVASSV